MLAAFHRDLVSAPLFARRPLFLRKPESHVNEQVQRQKNLREHAAGIAATCGFSLHQRVHLDQNGLSLVWTSAETSIARHGGGNGLAFSL